MKKNVAKLSNACLFLTLVLNSAHAFADADNHNAVMKLIGIQHQHEQQGKLYVERGEYEKAIEQFDKAIELDIKINGGDRGRPMAFKIKALAYQGNYKTALDLMNYLIVAHPTHEHYKDWKEELEILSIQNLTERDKKIYEYISRLKAKYAERLPPKGYWAYMEIPTILRLYDTIGDHDAGIKFIDEILNWTYDTDKDFKHLKNKINNSKQAEVCMELHKPVRERNPDSLACKWLREFLLVREAFEKDKAEGTQGRATKALTQSDYFPW